MNKPLLNFLLGGLLGAAIAVAATVHVLTTQVEKRNTAASDANEERIRQLTDGWRATLQSVQSRAEACEALKAEIIEHHARAAEVQRQEADLRTSNAALADSWYTLLYEPVEIAPAAGPSPLELVNLIRPGLGTMLAKLAPPPATVHGNQLRWVLRGYVIPVAIPSGWQAVYTRDPNAYAPSAVQ